MEFLVRFKCGVCGFGVVTIFLSLLPELESYWFSCIGLP